MVLRTIIAVGVVLAFACPAAPLPRNPLGSNSSVTCSCYCKQASGGKLQQLKNFTWNGSRSECQNYSGGLCGITNAGTSSPVGGTLSDCDIVVTLQSNGSSLGTTGVHNKAP